MENLIEEFDALLGTGDSDSLDWSDGGGSEKAEQMLQIFSRQEWVHLTSIYRARNATWRACFASILSLSQGAEAERLLIELAGDEDLGVAFTALKIIAFYCGVNDSATGPFLDLRIRSAGFLATARAAPELKKQIRRVSALSAFQFQKRFQLLLDELDS